MKVFKFEVEVMGKFRAYNKVIRQRANHLQGAIRQIYQNEQRMVRIVSFLGEC